MQINYGKFSNIFNVFAFTNNKNVLTDTLYFSNNKYKKNIDV